MSGSPMSGSPMSGSPMSGSPMSESLKKAVEKAKAAGYRATERNKQKKAEQSTTHNCFADRFECVLALQTDLNIN